MANRLWLFVSMSMLCWLAVEGFQGISPIEGSHGVSPSQVGTRNHGLLRREDEHMSLLEHSMSVTGKSDDNENPNLWTPSVKMSPEEESLLRKYFAQASNYLEFGSGGSTIAAVQYPNLKSIQVVENDPEWVGALHKNKDIHAAEASGRLSFHVRDIGPILKYGFGYPVATGRDEGFPVVQDEEVSRKFANYWDMKDLTVENLDFVLVDGRFRVNCFLNVLKHAGADTRIAIHDYFRPNYHVIENFAETVESVGRLSIFKARANIDGAQLDKVMSDYADAPGF